jgi:hypothetical protein
MLRPTIAERLLLLIAIHYIKHCGSTPHAM